MAPTKSKDTLVLVTGASGYIALHVVRVLLRENYRVRGTVRNLTNEKKLKPIKEVCPEAQDNLELVQADLMKDEGWTEAVKGCQFVMHIASPFPNAPPNREDDIIKPALEGTRRVLQACADDGGVKRLILTSSVCAIHGESTVDSDKKYSEEDWTDASSKFTDTYAKSKTLAEKAAWDFLKELPASKRFELSVINPGLVLGPILSNEAATSVGIIYRMMDRITMPLIPRIHFGICDVRDVALAHLKAMILPQAAGKRHLIVSDHIWMKEMAQLLYEEFSSQGYTQSLWHAPAITLWIYSFLDSSTTLLLPRLDKTYNYTNERMQKVLGIKPIDTRTSLVDTVYSLIESGVIKKTKNYKLPKPIVLEIKVN